MTAIETYQRYFPNFTPSCFQQDLIESTVTDMAVWNEVLTYWAGNDYRAQSIKKMLDYYGELTNGKTGQNNRFGKPTSADRLREQGDIVAQWSTDYTA